MVKQGKNFFIINFRFALYISLIILLLLSCGNKSTSSRRPEPPSNLSGHALSSSSVILFWADRSDNETAFIIYRKSDSSWIYAGAAPANQISCVDSLLRDSTLYIYRITAANDDGESVPSDTFAISTLSMGHPPNIPSNPSPSNDSIGVPLQVRLFWTCDDPDDDSLVYDIYFGTGSYLELLDSNLVWKYYDLDNLLFDTPYVWKIIARDNFHHSTSGPVWHFRTRPNAAPIFPYDPIPADDSIGVDINMNLNWQCLDPDGDSISYDVYFGQPPNVLLVASNVLAPSFNPGTLEYSTFYSWRVAAKDTNDNETRGPLWSFTTRDSIYQLSLLLQGMGSVVISPEVPGYSYGDTVTLTAFADSNWLFSRWTGDISGATNPLMIIITRNLSITAVFTESHSGAIINGTITWPGHALTSHTYFFADTLSSQLNLYLIGQTIVNPTTGEFTLILDSLPGPLPLLFEAQDDVNNSGPHDPLDMGDGWGYYDRDGDGRWLQSDTIFVAPGAQIDGINVQLHLIQGGGADPGD